jgi:hypothetical protein
VLLAAEDMLDCGATKNFFGRFAGGNSPGEVTCEIVDRVLVYQICNGNIF